MSRASRRAAALEQRVAAVLRTSRVKRRHWGESAPDVRPITLANGLVLQPEAKTRARLPRVVTEALAQAARYLPGAIPLAVIRQKGGPALAVLALDDFARCVGIAPAEAPTQPPLPLTGGA